MNIAICCYPSCGGSGVLATELGKSLAQRGHEVHFISSEKPFRLNNINKNIYFHQIEECNYPLFKSPPHFMLLVNKIVEVAKKYNVDIIHGHYAVPYSTAIMLAKDMLNGNVKTITTLHGTDVTIVGKNPAISNTVQYGINQSDGITVPSNYLAQEAKKYFSISKNIEIIHNFVDCETFKRCYVKELREKFVDRNQKLLIHISNFRSIKKVKDVIKVFERINKHVSSKLLMIGDGPEKEDACKLAEELGISNKVIFLGKQKDIVKFLSISDLFLLLSEEESFGLVLLEAMACNVPVLASNAGGIPEVIKHGKTGFLCKVGDIENMALKGLTILTDYHLHETMRMKARITAEDNFSTPKIISLYEKYYYKILYEDKFLTIA